MKSKIILIIGMLFIFNQCGTPGRLLKTKHRIPRASEARYQYILSHNNQYSALTIRSVSIKLSTPSLNTRLSGAIKMQKDSAIMLSLRAPLGIEVSRILYTPDSVKMVDRRNRVVHMSDYQNIAGLLPVPFDYKILETLITSNVPDQYKTLKLSEPKGIRDSIKDESYAGTFAAPEGRNWMNFYGWVYSTNMRPSYLVFYQDNSTEKLKLQYKAYEEIGDRSFPTKVEVNYDKNHHTNIIKLNLGHYRMEQSVDLDMGIPSSYRVIYH